MLGNSSVTAQLVALRLSCIELVSQPVTVIPNCTGRNINNRNIKLQPHAQVLRLKDIILAHTFEFHNEQ
jgi:hypothetical protein